MFKCLRPRKIVNQYTHEEVIVSCGHCEMCLSNKAAASTSQCFSIEKRHKFCVFVTLSYSDEYLPKAVCEHVVLPEQQLKTKFGTKIIPLQHRYIFTSICHRLDESGKVLAYIDSKSTKPYEDMVSFQGIHSDGYGLPIGLFCYCSTKDLQNFHKRFRTIAEHKYKKLGYDKSTVQEICKYKHYSVTEYGARHGRSHCHCLFWFDSQRLLEDFAEILSQAWQFGIVDFSLSRGGVSSYVANYINSSVVVPEVLTIGDFKTKQTHSVGFAKSLFESRLQDVYEYDQRQLVSEGFYDCKYNDTIALKGYVSYFCFPKCVNLSRATHGELYSLFTVLATAIRYCSARGYSIRTLSSIAENISFEYGLGFGLNSPIHRLFLRYYHGKKGDVVAYQQMIYRMLRVSKQFFDLCGGLENDNEYIIDLKIRQIENFYYLQDMQRLSDWYQEMEEKLNDSALWLTILFLYNDFLTRKCRLKSELFRETSMYRFLFTFQKYIDIPFLQLGQIEDLEFRQRYIVSQSMRNKHIKHKELTSIFNPNL